MNTVPHPSEIVPKGIRLGEHLVLPASAVTDTFAFFGTRGTGKTYGAGRTVEAFYDLGAQFVVIDPVGVWYGLRLAANGSGRGLDVPVFGGIHADVPLEATGGELVARLIVEQRMSAVLDVSMMSLGHQHRFVLAFATALFNLKKSDRSPLFALFDEAHEFAPQTPGPQEAEMLSAVRRLWKMGRNFGIGVGLVSPRPAEVNKGLVDLTERMFCGRLKGPRDRKAMESWADSQEADHSALGQLATLPSGELMYWGDQGPRPVRFSKKRTFDASKTPEQGDAKPTATLPSIDLDAVRSAMAATIEEAKASDPKALRARIAELEKKQAAPAAASTTVTIQVVPPALLDAGTWFGPGLLQLRSAIVEAERAATAIESAQARLMGGIKAAIQHPAVPPGRLVLGAPVLMRGKVPPPKVDPAPRTNAPTAGADLGTMPVGCRAVLQVLANFPSGCSQKKAAILCGYAPGGSTMRGILARLRKEVWVGSDAGGDGLTISADGLRALGSFEPLPSGEALRSHWINTLPKTPARFLDALIRVYPRGLAQEGLAAATGGEIVAGGSTMRGGLARLRALDLVRDDGGLVIASADLFE